MSAHHLIPDASPFDALDLTFARLAAGSGAPKVDGSAFSGLPSRPIPLDELRAILLHPSTAFGTRDTALGHVVAQAQEDDSWMVGLCGLLLPGLRSGVWSLARAFPQRAQDLESEALTALVVATRAVDPHRARLAAHLTWKARDGAKRLVRLEVAERARPSDDPVPALPPRPTGHPEEVLDHAVRLGVLEAEDAELIGMTRLGGVELRSAADVLGTTYVAARKRRVRAEQRLAAWLADEGTEPSFVPDPSPGDRSSAGTHPRRGRPRVRRPEQRRSDPSLRR